MKAQTFLGDHAIVIGGSMAGLLTARVLSNHFTQVTVLERDPIHDQPESRKGQPHTRHLHALLARGLQVMTEFFPDLPETLQAGGALVEDMSTTMRWYCYGGYRARFASGMQGVMVSRPFLEWQIRRKVAALSNVSMLDECDVEQLVATEDYQRISGVEIRRRSQGNQAQTLNADLIVDASGRGSASPKWLNAMGYARPEESTVKVNAGYATRIYRRDPDDPASREWIFITPHAPREKRMGGAFPVEGDRWVVSLGGWHNDHAPADEEGFLAYAQSLPCPDIYNLIRNSEPLSDIVLHKFPASLRRHYEKLTRFPEGYLVIGDALCSFNPLYGQGMTVAALEASELDRLLRARSERSGLQGIAPTFFKRAAKVIDIPWQTAVGEDFRFPETEGRKAPGTDVINAYVAQIHRATHHDPVVCEAFLMVTNLMTPPHEPLPSGDSVAGAAYQSAAATTGSGCVAEDDARVVEVAPEAFSLLIAIDQGKGLNMITHTIARQDPVYVLGNSTSEERRLQQQGNLINQFTRRVFEQAGIRPGMKVLDVGSGAGDVALLLAEMVGPSGSVVGIDRNPAILDKACERVAAAGHRNVSFIAGDIRTVSLEQDFDAAVGRLVLMYINDPADAIRHAVDHVRPGGVVAFQEADFTFCAESVPSIPLVAKINYWITETFRRGGVEQQMDFQLRSSMAAAGLPAPQLHFDWLIGGGDGFEGYALVANTLRSLLPSAQELGVASADEIGVDTIADRLRAEVTAHNAVLATISLIGAWTRKVN